MAYNYLSAPDPELAPLLAELPPTLETYTTDLAATREYVNTVYLESFRSVQRAQLPAETAYSTEDHKVAVEGGEIAVRSYTPSGPEGTTFPLFFWVHGGGWTLGNLETDDYYLRIISVELQLTVVSVDYRLAPEHPSPTGLNDSYAALKWTIGKAAYLHADLSKGFIICGQSAGANYTAVLAHRAKSDPGFAQYPVTGQILQIPILVHPDAVPEEYKEKHTSFVQNATIGNILKSSHLRDYYKQLGGRPEDPEISPLLQPSFEGLPPTYLQVCGLDPARDDGLIYYEKLQKAGVRTKLDVYPGAPHGFHLAFLQIKLAQKYDRDFRAGLSWLLAGAPIED